MLKTPESLDIGSVTSIGSSSWGGSTAGIGSVRGSTWSERIIFDAQPDRVLSKYFREIFMRFRNKFLHSHTLLQTNITHHKVDINYWFIQK